MNVLLAGLAPVQLERMADALDRPLLGGGVPFSSIGLEPGVESGTVVPELEAQVAAIGRAATAHVLRAVAAERRSATRAADRRLELVWTGPERDSTGTRDTAVVVRELFQSAERDVLVAGYALYNARAIFEPLVERMVMYPGLRVRLVVNIHHSDDARSDGDVALEFVRQFRSRHWPREPLPEVYYDPRSLDRRPEGRAVMHAKCVLVDGQRSFVTSANLTEAAQARNIELGVVINDAAWCRAVRVQFDDLIDRGALRRLDLNAVSHR
jgi:hypothetical protein